MQEVIIINVDSLIGALHGDRYMYSSDYKNQHQKHRT